MSLAEPGHLCTKLPMQLVTVIVMPTHHHHHPLSLSLGGEVTVRFSTSDLTAMSVQCCYSRHCTAGSDYSRTVVELVFSAAVRRHVVTVPTERFRATVVENNGINVVVNPASDSDSG